MSGSRTSGFPGFYPVNFYNTMVPARRMPGSFPLSSGESSRTASARSPASQPTRPIKTIAVFGKTGTGKTTFIQNVTGQALVVGHTLESSTKEVLSVNWDCDGEQVSLIDTPGFDDTDLSDTEVLSTIATWLKDAYGERVLLTGIIYLHPISDTRIQPSSKKSLRLFRSLCGDKNLGNVILATTMWENTSEDDGVRREHELRTKIWKEMIDNGSSVARITREPEDGRRLVKSLLRKNVPVVVELQNEMAVKGLSLGRTAAGLELKNDMEKTAKKYLAELKALREDLKGKEYQGQQMQAELKEEIEKLNAKLNLIEREKKILSEAKPSRLPCNRRPHGFLTAKWYCLSCREVSKIRGTITCTHCHLKQRNVGW